MPVNPSTDKDLRTNLHGRMNGDPFAQTGKRVNNNRDDWRATPELHRRTERVVVASPAESDWDILGEHVGQRNNRPKLTPAVNCANPSMLFSSQLYVDKFKVVQASA